MNGITLAGMATSRQFNYYNSAFDTRWYYNKECMILGLFVHNFKTSRLWKVYKVDTLGDVMYTYTLVLQQIAVSQSIISKKSSAAIIIVVINSI